MELSTLTSGFVLASVGDVASVRPGVAVGTTFVLGVCTRVSDGIGRCDDMLTCDVGVAMTAPVRDRLSDAAAAVLAACITAAAAPTGALASLVSVGGVSMVVLVA